jgi:filamentous hemagglutinin
LAKRAGIPEDIDLNSPSNVWGLNFKDLKTHYELKGYEAVIKPARASSSGKSQIFQLKNHKELSEVQYHPGGGVHEGSYYKFTYKNKTEVKIIDPTTYNPRTPKKGSIFFNT